MGLNKGIDRSFFVMGGSVKKTGGSIGLAKGQLAAVDQSVTSQDGTKVITSFAGKRKDAKDFVLKLGVANNQANRSFSNKAKSTIPFSLNEIVEVRVSAPERTEQIVDEVIIGYNGIDADTSFNFKTGDSYFRLTLELSGLGIAYRGGDGLVEMISVNIEVPHCDPFNTCDDCDNCDNIDCKAIINDAITRLRRTQLTGGGKVEDFVDITPILDCDNDVTATLIPYDYYTLSVCDTGGDEALAMVQAQYAYPVLRVGRRGSITVYQVLLPQDDGAPVDYEQGLASIIKGCDTCPAGYTEVPGGILYSFSIEDDGVDQSALITALPNYATGTIQRAPGHDQGVGQYTAVFTAALTDAQITTFVTGAAPRNTATVFKNGTVAAICTNGATTDTAWVLGDTCNVLEQDYTIILPDTECGDDRLVELQAAYSDLTVIIAQEDTANSQKRVKLTGTSGTGNITVNGVDYLATFATNLTVTSSNFVTAHAAAILADTGAVVTSQVVGGAPFIYFTDATTGFPTVTFANVSGNLGATVEATTVITQDVVGGCQTKYQTSVISNLVCDECDPIYLDYYITKAPENYGLAKWQLVSDTTTSPNGNCKCGIRFKGKEFSLVPEMALRNQVGFVESSTMIRVSAGYTEEIREGIGRLPKGTYEGVHLSRFTPRTHLAGNLLDMEAESNAYFTGYDNSKDYLGQVLRGETSNMEDLMKQYIDYTIVLDSSKLSQGFGKRIHEALEYHIFVGVGEHTDVEDLINDLASNAGVATVQAFGV